MSVSFSPQKVFRFLLSLAMIVAVLAISLPPGQTARAAVTFTITTATDAHDSNLGDGVCENGIDGCNLRAAIEQAFSVSTETNPVTIHFWSSGSILHVLNLGPINWAASYVTLDGEANNITISGSGLSAGQSIFTISGSNNTITHLTIRNAPQDGVQVGDFSGTGMGNNNTISYSTLIANGAAAVYIHGSSSSGGQANVVSGNYIGVSNYSVAGCAANEGNGGSGVYLNSSAQSNRIEANYIACNGYYGITLDGAGGAVINTQIINNDIGLTLGGMASNAYGGILDDHSLDTTISGNVISGNLMAGVWLLHSSGAILTSNRIGTDISGLYAVPNGHDGVAITDDASDNVVGGTASLSDRNLISGNTGCGIRIRDGAHNNAVDYNLIGLNIDGNAALPNQLAGVCIFNAYGNTIGTSYGGVQQFISGNTREGVYIENSSDTFVGQTNHIGVDTAFSPLGNGLEGVMVKESSYTSVFPTLIANNGTTGVSVVGATAVTNKIAPMVIENNGGLPIDLGGDGHTPNGSQSAPGPNNWIYYPVITGGGSGTVSGTACADCTVILYRAVGNPIAAGGGGEQVATAVADGAGSWSATLPAGTAWWNVTAQACAGPCTMTANTSEMSPKASAVYLPVIQR